MTTTQLHTMHAKAAYKAIRKATRLLLHKPAADVCALRHGVHALQPGHGGGQQRLEVVALHGQAGQLVGRDLAGAAVGFGGMGKDFVRSQIETLNSWSAYWARPRWCCERHWKEACVSKRQHAKDSSARRTIS